MQDLSSEHTISEARRRIVKATTITGGASLLNILFRVVQLKAVAVLLGTVGVGTMSLLIAISSTADSVVGMGLPTSGVRQISEAQCSNDSKRFDETLTVFRTLSLVLAVVGSLMFLLISPLISELSFGVASYTPQLTLLAIVVGLNAVSNSQISVVRATKRIVDYAKINIFGVGVGRVLALPVLLMRNSLSIALYLLLSTLFTAGVSWWYSNRTKSRISRLSVMRAITYSRELLAFGSVFMIASLLTQGASYVIKLLITYELGIEANGLYEASDTLSRTYAVFILTAMAADFYPQLTSLNRDTKQSIRLINDQVELGLVIATPGVIALLTLGPWFLQTLYSPGFAGAYLVLRWQVIGIFFMLASWPLRYAILARGEGKLFLIVEIASTAVYLTTSWLAITFGGLAGVGVAFFLYCAFYLSVLTGLLFIKMNFVWSSRNLSLMLTQFILVLISLITSYNSNSHLVLALGTLFTAATAAYAAKVVIPLMPLSNNQMGYSFMMDLAKGSIATLKQRAKSVYYTVARRLRAENHSSNGSD